MQKILVIDDMSIVRDPLAAALRAVGHQATTAANGREGLALVASDPPDLILLDLRMPEMDGLEFLRAIRSDARTADIAVILLSECRDKQSVLEIAKLGVQGYMLKSQ